MTKLRFVLAFFAAGALSLPAGLGCGNRRRVVGGTDAATESTGTSATGSTSSTTTSSDSNSGSGGSGPTSGGSGSTGGGEPQPDGGSCSSGIDCISGKCFLVPILGGVCGQCESDADCPDGGCTIPNPLAQPPIGSTCSMGENGSGCMSDDACDSGVCALILDVPGIATVSTCSECRTDAECGGGQLCQPTLDIANLTGEKTCIDPGTIEDGQACEDFDVTGDDACINYCDPADLQTLAEIGVCGECDVETDMGCDTAAGEVCNPPEVSLITGELTGASCGTGGGTGSSTGGSSGP